MNTKRADGKQPSALKICIAVSKEKGFSKENNESAHKNTQNRCLVLKQNTMAKNCGLLIAERIRDNKQKISPNLAKRTDFLCKKHKFWSE